eukprot:UN06347
MNHKTRRLICFPIVQIFSYQNFVKLIIIFNVVIINENDD